MPMIGFLGRTGRPGAYAMSMAAFREGLAEDGYVDGQDVALECRRAENHYDRLPTLAADLVDRKVNVIATGSMPSALAAKQGPRRSPSSSKPASTQSRRALSPASLGQAAT
jgi:putative ABC transport system substrate-binding protein